LNLPVSSKPLRIQRPSDSCPSCCPRSLMLERCFVTIFGIAQVHLLYTARTVYLSLGGGWYLNARYFTNTNTMIYAVVSYPACLVGDKYEFICWNLPRTCRHHLWNPCRALLQVRRNITE
jgi:hypothetical protein